MNCWGKGSRRIQNKGILTGRADGQQVIATLFSLVFLAVLYKRIVLRPGENFRSFVALEVCGAEGKQWFILLLANFEF